jgi:hypothetical protein
MKNILFILVLSLYSIQGFASSCPDGSEPIKSISDDGTYFVYKCSADAKNTKKSKTSNTASTSSSNIREGRVKASDISFPGKFYTTEIKSCKASGFTEFHNSFGVRSDVRLVEGLIGYDWHADWEANSTSIRPFHDRITIPTKMLMSATHNALGNNNQEHISIAKNLLVGLAKADTLYDSIGYNDIKKKPSCYADGDINSPCWHHEYQFATGVFTNYMITALWLRDELNEQEFKIVDKYINKMFKKFLQPVEDYSSVEEWIKVDGPGIGQHVNGGSGILAYASWTNNTELAAKEINFRFEFLDKLIFKDGYIDNNSFRGYRAQWYHSYGVNNILGYVYIADLWGAEVPDKLQKKLVKASEVVNLAITDWDKFKSREYTGSSGLTNSIRDPSNAIKHTHQMAFGLDTLMKIIVDFELAKDLTYLQKRKNHMTYGTDDLIGFNPNCIHKLVTE